MPGYELFGIEERDEILSVIDTGIFMRYGFDAQRKGRWKAKELEQLISQKINSKHTQLTSSGTAALSTALAACGVGAGDEVILPTFTFVASFEAIISVGAVPVFVDIDDTLTLNPQAVVSAITSKTKVVMPVHMCGSMAQLDELKNICQKHSLLLLEDACQAFGGTYNNAHLGTIGDVGVYSFDFVKLITCAEGGAIVTNNTDLAIKFDQYSDHGHDHLGRDRGADMHPYLGYNYRISELHAAVGIAQLKKIDSFLAIQRRNYNIIYNCLLSIDQLTFRRIPDENGNTCSFLSFFLPTQSQAQSVAQALAKEGLNGNPYWYDNNWHYIKKWEHLKNVDSMHQLYPEHKKQIKLHANKTFEASDNIISRCISSSISLLWSADEAKARGNKMVEVINNVLESNS